MLGEGCAGTALRLVVRGGVANANLIAADAHRAVFGYIAVKLVRLVSPFDKSARI
jgi:hypothetical protein